jgi:predicted nuclease of predicted toxin-antitoxin system
MRFIVDAQLPSRLSKWLCVRGHESIHTLDLPAKNRTDDQVIADFADANDRIVVTKDADFTALKLLAGKPKKLLLIKTGNLNNTALLRIFEANIDLIEKLFTSFEIVEVSKTMIGGGNLEQ